MSLLPTPISSSRRQHYRKPSVADLDPHEFWRRATAYISSRSRVSHILVLLLTICLLFLFAVNIRSTRFDPTAVTSTQRPVDIFDIFNVLEKEIVRPEATQQLQHLIIVPGHGIWLGGPGESVYNESTWALETYQRGDGSASRISAFISHIRKGIELATDDEESLLVFSGGSTRSSTPMTEAISYKSLAMALDLFPPAEQPGSSLYERATTEDYALDSFQNLLFSVARFREVTGHYPTRVTIVGYAMKHRRYEELHRKALRWPLDSEYWKYYGIDMEDEEERERAIEGEIENGYKPYETDLYGCHGTLLEKRRLRNVHHRAHPYFTSAPELAELLAWCPKGTLEPPVAGLGEDYYSPEESAKAYRTIFKGPLPWDR
ncbi:hypothetical protein SCHPADRAFT_821127 [Schizopora paradoxa]|uniref:DUF218 domain-containing protein n=1 Tax=Schizopora paradoxa TaxID=27342 RepID=A0A0H2SKS4_9AGAM|nr:hypothetical protein SCHPADRAFT_821127 [Schizopora paradoxa]